MRPIPNYGELITLKEFIRYAKNFCLIDSDGHGYYANGGEMSDELVQPSDMMIGKINRKWSHVVWFNK